MTGGGCSEGIGSGVDSRTIRIGGRGERDRERPYNDKHYPRKRREDIQVLTRQLADAWLGVAALDSPVSGGSSFHDT